MNPKSKKAPICFSGHMNTVHPIGLFGERPVRVDNEKIYGPGVADGKGGIAFLNTEPRSTARLVVGRKGILHYDENGKRTDD